MHNLMKSPEKLLPFILYLVAVHSFCVGIMLIIQPRFLMSFAGYGDICQRFFPTQGGVFHIVMAVCYTMGGMRPNENRCMIYFSMIAKAIATVFLLTYYVFVSNWVILVSGIGDGTMGLVIYFALRYYINSFDKKL